MNFVGEPNRLSIWGTSDWKNGPPSRTGAQMSHEVGSGRLVLFAGTLCEGATLCLFELP